MHLVQTVLAATVEIIFNYQYRPGIAADRLQMNNRRDRNSLRSLAVNFCYC